MTTVKFTPDAWRAGGQAYTQAGADLVAGVSSHLSVLDVNALGCNRGQHLIDQALAILLPAVKDAFEAACQDLAESVQAVGESMTATGDAYEQLEADQVELIADIRKEL